MKQIRVLKTFTLQVHQMDMRTYEGGKTYEVEDTVADNWWVRAHAEVLGEPMVPKSEPGVPMEEVIKKPVPNSKLQMSVDMVAASKRNKARQQAAEEDTKEEGPFE